MGGGYYDREVNQVASNENDNQERDPFEVYEEVPNYSAAAQSLLSKATSLHKSMDPKRWVEEKLVSTHKHPIVVAFDVTGSMGDWTKILFDKMPMFYGQLMIQGYVSDPSLSVCGVGDANCDKAPLQVGEFGQGQELDQIIPRMWLEGGGGCSGEETYELAAYFYFNHVELQDCELPFFFITGDELMYESIPKDQIEAVLGEKNVKQSFVSTQKCWDDLKKKYNVFYLHKPNYVNDEVVVQQWSKILGKERLLYLSNAKACVDAMLGAIALTSGSRTLDEYIRDMEERGQTQQRIKEITDALTPYAKYMNAHNIVKGGGGMNLIQQNQEELKEEEQFDLKQRQAEIKELMKQYQIHQATEEELRLKEFQKQQKNKIPEEYLCPLTMEIFNDPVTTVDGQTYERMAIETWFNQGHLKSPLTGIQLPSRDLVPNSQLKKLILEFVEKRLKDQQEGEDDDENLF